MTGLALHVASRIGSSLAGQSLFMSEEQRNDYAIWYAFIEAYKRAK